jgi:cytochrome subunit of sulfide dehydrogenase
MKAVHWGLAAIAVSVTAMAGAPVAVADVDRAAMVTTSCFACHSIDGTGNIPNLVGYPPDILVMQMRMFKDGTRPATIMDRVAKGYGDEDFVLMGEYFGTIKQAQGSTQK